MEPLFCGVSISLKAVLPSCGMCHSSVTSERKLSLKHRIHTSPEESVLPPCRCIYASLNYKSLGGSTSFKWLWRSSDNYKQPTPCDDLWVIPECLRLNSLSASGWKVDRRTLHSGTDVASPPRTLTAVEYISTMHATLNGTSPGLSLNPQSTIYNFHSNRVNPR
jgi:hypothetical protein